MNTKDKDVVSVGCKVRLFCSTDGEYYEYWIVKSRDTTEFIPQFGGYYENQNYDSRSKIAEYDEDELGDDRPLAKELLGKRRGDTVKVFAYTYQIEGISYNNEKYVEPITEFISRIYSSFDKYVNGKNKLCDLKSAAFYGGNLPDYSNEHVQQVYLLRYCLAYAYEYKQMYEKVFLRDGFSSEIEVASLGCGSMIDYWAFAEVLSLNHSDSVISYIGIDLNDWKYKPKKRECDNVQFLQKDVLEWLNETACSSSDIFIFPKSISEFNYSTFHKICDNFKNKRFAKDKIYVMVTLRYDPQTGIVNEYDFEKSNKIYDAFKANGFLCDDDANIAFPEKDIDSYVWTLDDTLRFPPEFDYTMLSNLSEKCCASNEEKIKCLYSCENVINRNAMLSTKYACYQVFKFYRRKPQ